MRIHYALYDSSDKDLTKVPGSNAYTQWRWWSEGIADSPKDIISKCDALYYDTLLKTKEKATAKVWGGFLKFDNDYTVLYRHFDRPYPEDGRVGDFYLTAWIKTKETQHKDLSQVFNDEIFQYVAEAVSSSGGVPKPEHCFRDVNAGDMEDGTDRWLRHFPPESGEFRCDVSLLKRATLSWAADKGERVRSAIIVPFADKIGGQVIWDLLEKPKQQKEAEKEIQATKPDSLSTPPEPDKNVGKTTVGSKVTFRDTLIVRLLFATIILLVLNTVIVSTFFGGAPSTKRQEQTEPPTKRQAVKENEVKTMAPIPQSVQSSRKPTEDEIIGLFVDLVSKKQFETIDRLDEPTKRNIFDHLSEQRNNAGRECHSDESREIDDSRDD